MSLNLQHVYIGPSNQPILKDISLSVDAGELVALTGMNGTGKTTLIKAIAGEQPLLSGRIEFNKKECSAWSRNELAQILSVLPQRYHLSFPFSVEEVVMLGRSPHKTGLKKDKEIVASALKFSDAFHLRDKLYTQLSGGEQQRVQLARVVCQIWQRRKGVGRILLLDEPNAGLDLAHQQEMFRRLKKLTETGIAGLFVAHDLNLAAQFASRVIVLSKGQIAASGYPEKVFTTENLSRYFRLQAEVTKHPVHAGPLIVPI